MSLFRLGKAKISHCKNTAEMKPCRVDTPSKVLIPMSQHIGAPAKVCVSVGDKVSVGTLIGEACGFVSSPVYSSISGVVKKIEKYLLSNGKETDAVLIESDGENRVREDLAPISVETVEQLQAAARESGVVGLGGAGFPTAVKLSPKNLSEIDTLILNGAECEPYITSDTRTMLDESDYLKDGVNLISRIMGIKNTIIGIENNKKEAIKHLSGVFADNPSVEIKPLKPRYPQGAEKVLIYNTTGRVVMEGELPSSVGVIVMNVTTLVALMKYIRTGMPLCEKCITLDGSAVKEPKNLIVPIGMSVGDVISAGGGLKCEAGKILYGGPMMGVAIYSLDAPILKNNNAILVFDKKDATIAEPTACIHCGRCVATCPMGLNPTVFAKSLNLSDKSDMAERLAEAKINLCIECGCCSYVCPAKRPLVENNRLAKSALREYNANSAK